MKVIFQFLLIFILSTSCTLIHLTTLRKNTGKNRTQYQKYLSKLNLDTTNSFQLKLSYFDSLSIEKFALNTYKLEHNRGASPAQVRVYDQQGNLFRGYEQCFGEIKKMEILDSFPLKKISFHPVNYSLELSNDLNLFIEDSLQMKKILNEAKSKKYTYVIFYAEWMGFYSKSILKAMKKHLKNEKSDVLLIYVNTEVKKK